MNSDSVTRSAVELRRGGVFYEAPRWHGGRWWVSDQQGTEVLAISPEDGTEVYASVPGGPSGLGWLPGGDLLVVSMSDRRVLRRRGDGQLVVHADLAEFTNYRINDMIVNSRGQAYVGCIGFDDESSTAPFSTGSLIRVDPDGTVSTAAECLRCPNGSFFLDGERTLVVGETMLPGYTAFTVQDNGTLTERRTWAQIGPTPASTTVAEMFPQLVFAPDGCAGAPDGTVWSADLSNARCVHLAEGGDVIEQVDAPAGQMVFACALGGPSGRTLLLCVAPDWDPRARKAEHNASLITVEL
ncbi:MULTISPECIES: SMP-30/gluconolactonase/LRE family protein [unclassified Pseudofrankia]|uniref:SMP-30/gluconolactonase/LRE family protein n=1 Tax=unclassified Pseudofrankia TaxID=2994372 RepID=UPI0008D9ACDF|nr:MULTISPECIES: SMP-30/gluconolactonase/LRE family protein [unclassified Pseudofrankia]MDT3445610.1 SMP-30/gluconolactonase/LRE family protein [Pseudofrankia sp. BMG5.37]OHV63541.1 hypothetical protein BCD48_38110 [Pseudofrankia sp. BMG5.36]